MTSPRNGTAFECAFWGNHSQNNVFTRESEKRDVYMVEVLSDGGGRLGEWKDLVPFLDLPSIKLQPRCHAASDRTTKAQIYFHTS